jgi:hypothetical protein
MDMNILREGEKLRTRLNKYKAIKGSLEHLSNIRLRLFTVANTEIEVSFLGLVSGAGAGASSYEVLANNFKDNLELAVDVSIAAVEAELAALGCGE